MVLIDQFYNKRKSILYTDLITLLGNVQEKKKLIYRLLNAFNRPMFNSKLRSSVRNKVKL